MGNESVIAPSYVLNQLILKGMHRTYDELISEYDFKDYAFDKLRERYKAVSYTHLLKSGSHFQYGSGLTTSMPIKPRTRLPPTWTLLVASTL